MNFIIETYTILHSLIKSNTIVIWSGSKMPDIEGHVSIETMAKLYEMCPAIDNEN